MTQAHRLGKLEGRANANDLSAIFLDCHVLTRFCRTEAHNASSASYRVGVLRYMFQSRWWPWHLLCGFVFAALVLLGYWQMRVAFNPGEWHGEELSIRNFVYALQWWVFAAFAIWFWYRYMRDQRQSELGVAAEDQAIARARQASKHATAPDTDDSTSAGNEPISLDAPADERRQQIFGSNSVQSEGANAENDTNLQNKDDGDQGSVSSA